MKIFTDETVSLMNARIQDLNNLITIDGALEILEDVTEVDVEKPKKALFKHLSNLLGENVTSRETAIKSLETFANSFATFVRIPTTVKVLKKFNQDVGTKLEKELTPIFDKELKKVKKVLELSDDEVNFVEEK